MLKLRITLLVLVASATCTAAENSKGDVERPTRSFSRSDGPPVLLDFEYEFRINRNVSWNAGRAMFRMPWNRLSWNPGAASKHMLGTIATFEQGANLSPNPRRIALMACYYFGHDASLEKGGGGDVLQTMGDDHYPVWRPDFFTAGLGGAVGWLHAEATERAAKGDGIGTQEALRVESWVHVGLFVLQHEMRLALNVHMQDGSRLSIEFGTRLSIGRPIFPAGLFVGYWYVSGPRIGGHYVTVGVEFDL